MSEMNEMAGAGMYVARKIAKASTAFGGVLVAFGILAIVAPLFTGIATTVLVGMLLLGSGIVETVFAFKAESFGRGALTFLFGGLGILVGLVLLVTPGQGLTMLTLMLAVMLVAGGVTDILLAIRVKPEEGWGWMVFSGLISVALGGLILSGWPVSGIWAIGLFVGIRLLTRGWMLLALGRSGQEELTNLQDTRLAVLENHVRTGAQAIQQTQVALADHAAMLLALDNELRKKVSSAEIDPAIVELNQKLGKARVQMAEAEAATKEAWDKTQGEANVAFEKLQQSAAEITKRLKSELGLEKNNPPSAE